jgi:hypothetical protein
VVIDGGTMRDRFVICRNPVEAVRDATIRDLLLKHLQETNDGTDGLPEGKRAEIECKLRGHPAGRFLRVTPRGLLRIDQAKVGSDANLDGKYLLRTSDPTLTAEDVALGYKQLLQVERAWRDMKTRLDLRPMDHRKEESHPCPCRPLLAWPPPDSRRRERHCRHLARPALGAREDAPRPLRRPQRDGTPPDRHHPPPAGHLPIAQRPGATQLLPHRGLPGLTPPDLARTHRRYTSRFQLRNSGSKGRCRDSFRFSIG